MRRTGWIGAAAACVLLVSCGDAVPQALDGSDRPKPRAQHPSPGAAASADRQVPELPHGWRWESYRGLEIGVPGEWSWGNGGQRINQWCVEGFGPKGPMVGRPGPETLVGCQGDATAGPGWLAKTGTVLSFEPVVIGVESEADPDELQRHLDGDRLTLELNGAGVTIIAEPGLRERIAATIHAVDVDSYGCPVTDPISQDPGRRPDDPVAVESLTGVIAVSACRYALPAGYYADRRLVSSLRLEGRAAADVVDAIAAAPAGGGPDRPSTCLKSVSYGEEAVVLRVTSDQGEAQVYLRYSGCDHNGFDDGVTVRRLTVEAVGPLVAGPNQVQSASGPTSKFRMLRPDLKPAE